MNAPDKLCWAGVALIIAALTVLALVMIAAGVCQ